MGRQRRRAMPVSWAMRASSAWHSAAGPRRPRSGGTRISITLRRAEQVPAEAAGLHVGGQVLWWR
jgi:hypothetical protein